MKNRSCVVRVCICNDAGKESWYGFRPVAAADLASAAAAFLLVNLSKDPSPIYLVRLAVDGQTTCSCPQHTMAGGCKHCDALAAAGVLPSALLGVLQERSKLLDAAEAEAQRLAEAAMEERQVHEHDAAEARERIADLTAELSAVAARAVQLQNAVAAIQTAAPKRRRAAKAKAA